MSFIFFKKIFKYMNKKIIKRTIFNIYRLFVYMYMKEIQHSPYLILSFSTLFFLLGYHRRFLKFHFHTPEIIALCKLHCLSLPPPPIFSRCFMFRFCLILYTVQTSLILSSKKFYSPTAAFAAIMHK